MVEKNVNSAELGWNILYASNRSIWFMVLFRSEVSSLTFCLEDWFISVFPSIIVLGYMCDLMSHRICFYESSCTYVWHIDVDYHYGKYIYCHTLVNINYLKKGCIFYLLLN